MPAWSSDHCENSAAPLTNLTEADFATEGTFYQMGRPPAWVNILMSIPGLRFADAWHKRVKTDFGGVPAYVLSREDLIVNKRAVGRPQDLVDVSNLEEAERVARTRARGSDAGDKPPKGRQRKRRGPR